MTSEPDDPVMDLVTEYSNAQSDKDPDRIAATFAEDGLYVDSESLNHSQWQGKEQIADYFQQVYSAYPDLVFTIDAIVPQPGSSPELYASILVAWTFEGTHTVDTEVGGPATGERVIMRGADFVQVDISQQTPIIIAARSKYIW